MSPEAPPARGRALAAGERVLLVDRKDRRYLVTLHPGRSFQSHAGVIEHDSVIGRSEGEEVEAHQRDGRVTSSARYLVLRPTLADVVVGMPRGAQVIYPKDLGAILIAADIFPGARVLEAGVGSGALSMAMLRAGAVITGYELRADFAERARANVEAFLGPDQPYSVLERDVYLGIETDGLDRVVLDLAEPWQVVTHAEKALAPGGIFLAYLPTINQTAELRGALERSAFAMAETFEILRRTWHIEGRSVRPDHRMVAHTGFITHARLLASLSHPSRRRSEAHPQRVARSSRPPLGYMPCLSLGDDEDALPRALFGSFGDGVFEIRSDCRHLGGAAGFVEDGIALLHIGQAVVEESEHGGTDLLAEPVSRAEVLVNPHPHQPLISSERLPLVDRNGSRPLPRLW